MQKANYINSEWLLSEKSFSVLNKYSQTEIAQITLASEEQLELCIQSAKKSKAVFKSWTSEDKNNALKKLYHLVAQHQEKFEKLIVTEAGKPISYAKAEVNRALRVIELSANACLENHNETVNVDYDAGVHKKAFTISSPLGVVACITPFNFPLNLVLHKVAPAIAAGCPVILKPALETPLTAIMLAELIHEIDLPKGAFNCICCENELAEKLVKDENVDKLSFTGSDKVGWYLKAKAGKKSVTLELGGNAACIVNDSQNLKEVAKKVAIGAYLYAGQICISTQRILVQEKIKVEFVNYLVQEIDSLRTDNPENPDCVNGPIISNKHLKRIDSWVKEACDKGATVLRGAKIVSDEHNLYAPTLLENVSKECEIYKDEVFGPVAILETYQDVDEAIDLVNESRFGLQVGVFTNDFSIFNQSQNEIDCGGIIFNNIPGFRVDGMPYGGFKDSGLGKEGIHYAINSMTKKKLIVY